MLALEAFSPDAQALFWCVGTLLIYAWAVMKHDLAWAGVALIATIYAWNALAAL